MRSKTRAFVCLLALLASLALPAALVSQAAPQEPTAQLPAVHTNRIEFQLRAGSGGEWLDGDFVSRTGVDLRAVTERCRAAGAFVQPLVASVSWDELDRLHRHACAVMPARSRPGHLGLWYRAICADAAAADALLEQLQQEPLVAHAYREPIYYPASYRTPVALPPQGNDPPPTTPSFVAQQLAHSASPVGHGVRMANSVLGARGQDVGFYMVENTWILGHEDVSKLVSSNFLGVIPAPVLSTANHGLSGASISFADRNAFGITGISDLVDARFLSIDVNNGLADSLALVAVEGDPGDVTLLVLMVLVPGLGPGTFLPIEFYQSAYDAVATVTAQDIHLVAPSGNGNRSLDDPALLGRFSRSFRDSGAVIVSASAGGALQRAVFSNWGGRVDAHSWGDGVIASGYGDLFFPGQDPLQAYTQSATGTSSATPHIASVIACIQGACKRQLGTTLSNQEILDLLHTYGPDTPDVIGRRPDLVEIFDVLGIRDGLSLAEPDVELGGSIDVTIDGPAGSIAGLFAAFAEGDAPVGFNRNLHLDPNGTISIDAYVLGTPGPQYQLAVPVDASLHGAELFFQSARLLANQPVELTNSVHVTIL
ncbi:MAG: S8 family serine peptidase [Planctomycetota bacterium]